ncbi:BPSL0067 family protein [Paracidovorax citrulli]|nr:BPSL0067 family protein [Paracidovorax citrulli]UEG45019.1 BPSL0067 family protein [Paracidovorax citrulli]WIY28025.1 BPSL0067 family protein [Paracidovorax citrulli]WIY33482.1 BPSL0067 family protein [Paracidovorax citrulli]WIY37257.1 BPSL0067 family protein [Paracidovorax citrulli]WIY45529.1 BPSL0067 family protein [Paracidovorax citrulli]
MVVALFNEIGATRPIAVRTKKAGGFMPYVSLNYKNNSAAPVGKWTCAPTSNLQPFGEVPPTNKTGGPNFCGQCVSYVKKVCPSLPGTTQWRKGAQVKDNQSIAPGTAIATFNASGHYEGHAAIYVSQDAAGIKVYDQYVTPPSPKAVGPRVLRWGAHGNSNNGNNFYVIE